MRAAAIATLIVSVSVCVGAARAHAQAPEAPAPQPGGLAPQPERPAPQGSAVFGAADARGLAERSGRLDLLVQLFGGYDDDVLAQSPSGSPSSQPRLASAAAGLATGVGASINYSRPGLLFNRPQGKGDFRGWLDSSLRFYPAVGNLTGTYHSFGLRLSAPVTRRVTFFASPHGDYAPRYSFELLSGPLTTSRESPQPSLGTDAGPEPDIDYSVVTNNSFRYGVIGGADIELGTRSSFTVDAGYSKTQSNLANFDMEVRDAGVSFDHQFSRDATLELGYSYSDGSHAYRARHHLAQHRHRDRLSTALDTNPPDLPVVQHGLDHRRVGGERTSRAGRRLSFAGTLHEANVDGDRRVSPSTSVCRRLRPATLRRRRHHRVQWPPLAPDGAEWASGLYLWNGRALGGCAAIRQLHRVGATAPRAVPQARRLCAKGSSITTRSTKIRSGLPGFPGSSTGSRSDADSACGFRCLIEPCSQANVTLRKQFCGSSGAASGCSWSRCSSSPRRPPSSRAVSPTATVRRRWSSSCRSRFPRATCSRRSARVSRIGWRRSTSRS